MIKYCLRRIINLIPVLLAVTFCIFLLMYLTPGDPALMRLSSQGTTITEEMLTAMREEMGLNQPFLTRYFNWLKNLLRGDFGISYATDQPIFPMMVDAVRHTVILAAAGTIVSVVIGIPVGVFTAIHKDKLPDNIVRVFTFVGNSMPNFLISLLVMYLLCIKFKLFPVIAKGTIKGLALPVFSLAAPMISKVARQTRADVLSQLGEEYVIGMHARGVKEVVILYKNVLHNALGGVITLVSLQIRVLLGGTMVIETIFRWPGVGSVIIEAIYARDYPVVQGVVVVIATMQILINLLTDISYGIIDKRIKLE